MVSRLKRCRLAGVSRLSTAEDDKSLCGCPHLVLSHQDLQTPHSDVEHVDDRHKGRLRSLHPGLDALQIYFHQPCTVAGVSGPAIVTEESCKGAQGLDQTAGLSIHVMAGLSSGRLAAG